MPPARSRKADRPGGASCFRSAAKRPSTGTIYQEVFENEPAFRADLSDTICEDAEDCKRRIILTVCRFALRRPGVCRVPRYLGRDDTIDHFTALSIPGIVFNALPHLFKNEAHSTSFHCRGNEKQMSPSQAHCNIATPSRWAVDEGRFFRGGATGCRDLRQRDPEPCARTVPAGFMGSDNSPSDLDVECQTSAMSFRS